MISSVAPMVTRPPRAVVLGLSPSVCLALSMLSLLISSALVCSTARAHALVDEGRRLYEEAEFVAALDALGRATAGTDLTRADLEELLELRALVHSGLGDEAAVRADLQALAVIAPDHTLHRGIPPDVQRAFAEIRGSSSGPPRLLITPEASSGGVTIRVAVDNDWAHLVRAVRIRGRALEGTFSEAIDAPLFVATPNGEVVRYYAEAVGPGGAVIASSGSESAPLEAAGSAAVAGTGLDPWPFVIGGAAAVVVGVVIAVVVVTTSGTGQPTTAVSPFTVRF